MLAAERFGLDAGLELSKDADDLRFGDTIAARVGSQLTAARISCVTIPAEILLGQRIMADSGIKTFSKRANATSTSYSRCIVQTFSLRGRMLHF